MKITFVILLIAFTLDSFSQDKNVSTNPYIYYSQISFDSDTCCWRKLCADKKYTEAANLITSYLDNNNNIKSHQSLNWHAGQMFALAGNYSSAKKYFRKTYSEFYKWFGGTDGKTWYYYAKGTIAFIDSDKKTLETIINRWKIKYPLDNNYKVLLKLNDNWGKSYEFAY